jgi:hypothetical protein
MYAVRRDPEKGYIDSWLWVPRTFINVDGTKRSLTHQFTGYGGATTILTLYREAPYHLLVPRAFWDPGQLPFSVVDCRPTSYDLVEFRSNVQLDHRIQANLQGEHQLLPTGDDVQQKSFNAMQAALGGILQLACGKGKTPTALHYIAKGRVPTLVMVDNTQLMEQWQKEIDRLIEVPGGVGVIAEGRKDWHKGLVLGTYISVANWAETMPEEVRRYFGKVIWDEGHHLSAPVFSKTAPLFYGERFCLTATPERDDGYHIIADMHVGKVVYKDLTQPLKARFIFYWTGFELDLADPQCAVIDKNGEVHTSKVFKYFGRWRNRLWRIMQDCIDSVQSGRKVLVVCNSVDEVVNLMALWTRGHNTPLITDIPYPLPQEVGESLQPYTLGPMDAKRLESNIHKQAKRVEKAKSDGTSQQKLAELEGRLISMQTDMERYHVYRKLENENDKRRRAFIQKLTAEPSTAGFMTREVPAKKRREFVLSRDVTFAIMKYGKEGLDAPHLDTILVSTPFSNRGGLQQLMGRITGRPLPGKKKCMVVFYRDNIGVMHGMCDKLEKHLRQWPVDEGGPFDYEHINNPARMRWQTTSSSKDAFGQS